MPVAPPEPVVQKKNWAEKPYSRKQRRRDIGESKLFSQLIDDAPTSESGANPASSLRGGMKKTLGAGEKKKRKSARVSFAAAPETIPIPVLVDVVQASKDQPLEDCIVGQRNTDYMNESTSERWTSQFTSTSDISRKHTAVDGLNEIQDNTLVLDNTSASTIDSAPTAANESASTPLPVNFNEIFASLTVQENKPALWESHDTSEEAQRLFSTACAGSASSNMTLADASLLASAPEASPPSHSTQETILTPEDCLSSLFAVDSDTDEEEQPCRRRGTKNQPAAVDIQGWLSDAAKNECVGIIHQSSLVTRRHRAPHQRLPYERAQAGRRPRSAHPSSVAHFAMGGEMPLGTGMSLMLGRPSVKLAAAAAEVPMDVDE